MEESVLTSFHIRPAAPGDGAQLHRLIVALAEYEKLAHLVTGTAAQLEHWLFGPQPVIEAALAVDRDGHALGFALWYTTYSTFLARPGIHLEDLFVEPARRGEGIGKALLAHLARVAEARGCGRLEWNVLDWNTPSIDFYRSLNAKLMPEWVLVRMVKDEYVALGRSA
jgi:GNAT superfamily N-acetyltransferase